VFCILNHLSHRSEIVGDTILDKKSDWQFVSLAIAIIFTVRYKLSWKNFMTWILAFLVDRDTSSHRSFLFFSIRLLGDRYQSDIHIVTIRDTLIWTICLRLSCRRHKRICFGFKRGVYSNRLRQEMFAWKETIFWKGEPNIFDRMSFSRNVFSMLILMRVSELSFLSAQPFCNFHKGFLEYLKDKKSRRNGQDIFIFFGSQSYIMRSHSLAIPSCGFLDLPHQCA